MVHNSLDIRLYRCKECLILFAYCEMEYPQEPRCRECDGEIERVYYDHVEQKFYVL